MSNQECESNLIGCVFLSALSLEEVIELFEIFKANDEYEDDLDIITFSSEKDGTIMLEDIEDCSCIDHEALARFIASVIAPGDATIFEVEFGGAKDHGWLVQSNAIHHLNYEPRVGNLPWKDFATLYQMRLQQAEKNRPSEEVYYQWKEFVSVGDEPPRLVTPWANPKEYEYSFDYQFDTPSKALQGKIDFGAEDEDEWVLCKVTTSPLEPFCDVLNDDGTHTEESLERKMQIAKDIKKEFSFCKSSGKWFWYDRGCEKDLVGPFDTFLSAVDDAVEPYWNS